MASALIVELPDGSVRRFSRPFHIGRDVAADDLQVQDVHVSRRHAAVSFDDGEWTIRDLQSANGVWVDDERVEAVEIGEGLTVTLGADGPSLYLRPETFLPALREPQGRPEDRRGTAEAGSHEAGAEEGEAGSTEDSVILEDYARRYFGRGATEEEEVGGRTMMIRRAFDKVQRKQKRTYRLMLAAAVIVGLGAGGYAYYVHRQMQEMTVKAQEVFYAMKAIDVNIAGLQQEMEKSGSERGLQQVRSLVDQRRQIERSYDEYARELYDRRLNERDRLVLEVTRLFGECEIAAPREYLREVQHYIQRWQSTSRLATAVKRAQDLGYTKRIANELIAHDLPPQYFYLALQESGFDAYISGPRTRWGIAKGMWQFIPETGARYGLTIGPLRDVGRPDAQDDRFKWDKATTAAAKYIKDIYATDAQASGLLVIASYNWGERRIIDLLRTMPADPRQRNFWKLLERHRERVPEETYNYVFSIISAAVIGENPRLFGFQFDNPLKFTSGGA
jgi:membrane-bound lytic murein transglycosylase D